MVVNLLPEHVELPSVLDLTVLLIQLTTWMGRGGYNETFFPFNTSSLEYSFMVKSYGWWWGRVGGPCDYSVTPVPIGLGFGTAFRKEIVLRKNFRICQFEHNLQDVPKMIYYYYYSFYLHSDENYNNP